MPSRSPTPSSPLAALSGYGCVLLLALGAPVAAHPPRGGDAVVAVVLAVVAASVTGRIGKRPAAGVLGVVAAALGLLLTTQARQGATLWVLAVIVGAGVGMAARLDPRRRPGFSAGVVVALAQVVFVARVGGVDAARLWALVGAPAFVVTVAAARGRRDRAATAPVRLSPAVTLMVVSAVTGAWIGANSPSARWFGDLVSHGPRSGNLVAITFDDGPDVPYTLQVRDILDAHGVKATFFTVGKALDARPDVSAALQADGDVLGNHSYRHDERGWLDPRYPELGMTQRAFRARLGVCPTFFRPPHGQHTPAMAWQVHRAGMRMIGWDVSAGDWATTDAALVVRRVLSGVRAGSIIDLHDGLDGKVTADRSVLVRALPGILDGLATRGLHPVTLDRLLGVAPYAGSCG